jgi:hypothetical protein
VIRGAVADGTNGGGAFAEHMTAAPAAGRPADLRYAADPGDVTGATTPYSGQN